MGIVLLMAAITVLGNSCQKYPDGPGISLRSRAERVANSWRVEKYLRNDIDQTAYFLTDKINYVETFTLDGSWSVSYFDYKDNKQRSSGGTWQFANDERQILRVTDNDAQLFNIMRLKEKELWFWYIDNGDKREYHLIQN